ncbi:MAG: hypothetical protein J6B34_04690 [Clostridia bacterium]|nr:hypothetical protein [Clostridia bacterium]
MERKSLKIDSFVGLDKRENKALVDAGSLFKSTNLLYKNGALRKRQGQRTLYQFRNEELKPVRIDGIMKYKDDVVVYAGGDFYRCNCEFTRAEPISRLIDFEAEPGRCQGEELGEYLVITGAGEPLVYDGLKMYPLSYAPFVYVPHTSEGGRDHHWSFRKASKEVANVLTGRRINTLFGTDTEIYGEGYSIFQLDAPIKRGGRIEVTVKLRVKREGDIPDLFTSPHVGVSVTGEQTNTIVTARFLAESGFDNDFIYLCEPLIGEHGEEIKILSKDKTTPLDYTQMDWSVQLKDKDKLIFNFDLRSPFDGADNVRVDYVSLIDGIDTELKGAKSITSTYGAGGGQIMMLALGDKVLFSHNSRGIGYIPETNIIRVGGKGDIVSVVPMSQSHIGIFKRDSFAYAKMSPNGFGFTLYPTLDTIGAVSPFVTTSLRADVITLSDEGVFGVSDITSSEVKTKFLESRGERISPLLSGFTYSQLQNAVGQVHDNIFYLFVGDGAFCMSTERRYSRDNGFEYEWYYLENMQARVALSVNGALLMGREDGCITTLCDNHYDEEITKIFTLNGDMLATYNDSETAITLNSKYELTGNETLRFSTHYVRWLDGIPYDGNCFSLGDKLFDADGSIIPYEEMKVAVVKDGYAKLLTRIREVDPLNGKIILENQENLTQGEAYSLYLCDEMREFTFETENGVIYPIYRGKRAKFITGTISYMEIIKRLPIDISLVTSPTYFGSTECEKRLHEIILRLSRDTNATLRVGYISEDGERKREIVITPSLDLDSLDFSTLDFHPTKSNKRVRLHNRGFTQLGITISSDNPRKFGLEEITVVYSMKNSKGGF